jgi:hypothetical protein
MPHSMCAIPPVLRDQNQAANLLRPRCTRGRFKPLRPVDVQGTLCHAGWSAHERYRDIGAHMRPKAHADIRTPSERNDGEVGAVSSSVEPMTDLLNAMAGAYGAELARRRLVTSRPQVFEVSGDGGPLIPPGSLLMATGAVGEQLLADLAVAARAGDAQRVSDVISRIRGVAKSAEAERRRSGIDELEALAAIGTFGQVSYGGQLIAHAQMITSSMPVSLAFLPFNGGSLPAPNFSVSHYHNLPDTRAETLVIVRQPLSTDIEARVNREFSAVSADELLGPARPEANWLVAAAFVGVVAAGVAGAYYFAHRAQEQVQADQAANEEALGGVPTTLPSEFADLLADLAPMETQVANMSAQAPTRALIQLRTELLKGKRIG